MKNIIRSVSLWTIYAGIVSSLAVVLLVDSRFFFPFISTKVFFFRTIVEVMLLAYAVLNAVSDEYRPRLNRVVYLAAGFIVIAAISSLLNGTIYRSFWGDIERGEGLILWLHLLVFLVISVGTVRKRAAWLALMDTSVGIAVLTALFGAGQALKSEVLLASSGVRVDATFGNAAFFAGYILMHIGFAVYLASQRSHIVPRLYYAAVTALFVWVVFATQTRGAVLGLVAGVVVSLLLSVYAYRQNRAVRRWSLAALVVVVVLGGALYAIRDSDWVRRSPLLNRALSISLSERTAETRLATWRAAWQGWREKPVFGWGFENFDRVFDENFPPIIYEDPGSQVWFDRAHNVIFDKGVTTGALGLAVFLGLLAYPGVIFLRKIRNGDPDFGVAIIFFGLLVAYLVQDMLVFESVATYIILFFALAFWSSEYLPARNPRFPFPPKQAAVFALVVCAIATPFIVWHVNWQPARLNIAAAKALDYASGQEEFFKITDALKPVIESGTYGRQEYRLQFIEFVSTQLASVGEITPEVRPILDYTDAQADKQIAEAPDVAKNYLLAMRHFNYTYASLAGQEQSRLERALSYYPQLSRLSPTRPQVPQEAGYSHLYLFRLFKGRGDEVAARTHADQAENYFRQTVELNPKVVDSYINLIMLYLNLGDDGRMTALVEEMDRRGAEYRRDDYLARLTDLAKANQRYLWIAFFAGEQAILHPEVPEVLIDAALGNAYLGRRAEAISYAEKIRAFGGEYQTEADQFIQQVKSGYFEQQAKN